MSNPVDIVRLYSAILLNDVRRYSLSDGEMKSAIASVEQVYKPVSGRLLCPARPLADYNSMADRCAYLHKYASFHTGMVHDIMKCILLENDTVYRLIQRCFTSRQKFKICSLGGGPGSDTVGALVAMFKLFGLFPCSAKVIDLMTEWKDTLTSVFDGLHSGMCGAVGEGFTQPYFNWDFLTADLLEEVHNDVKSVISSADMVMMVKFVSAAACDRTEWMLKKIFTMLKLGAVVLFIDNSSGGYREVVSKAATDCNLTSVCGPIKYQVYTNERFKITHWGHTSCYSTTVTVHMMQKLRSSPPFNQIQPQKIVNSTPKPNISFSSTDNNNNSCSGLEAENVALQAKLNEMQEKSLKERNEFIAKIAELEKTLSSNESQIKTLTETIQTLEKYKSDVADYKVRIVSVKGEIANLKKELEKAKLLQEQALGERQIQQKEMDLMTTVQHQRVLGSHQPEVVENVDDLHQTVLGSNQPKVVENVDNLKTSSKEIAPLKTRTSRRKLQEQENKLVKKAMKFTRKKIMETPHSGSSGISSLRVTRSCKKLFNAGVGPKKTKPNLVLSVNNMPSPRTGCKKLFNVGTEPKKTQPKRAQSLSNTPSSLVLRGRKNLFNSDIKPNTKEAKPKLTQSIGSACSPRETRGRKKLLMSVLKCQRQSRRNLDNK